MGQKSKKVEIQIETERGPRRKKAAVEKEGREREKERGLKSLFDIALPSRERHTKISPA